MLMLENIKAITRCRNSALPMLQSVFCLKISNLEYQIINYYFRWSFISKISYVSSGYLVTLTLHMRHW